MGGSKILPKVAPAPPQSSCPWTRRGKIVRDADRRGLPTPTDLANVKALADVDHGAEPARSDADVLATLSLGMASDARREAVLRLYRAYAGGDATLAGSPCSSP